MKLSWKFFCIAYIIILLSTGIGGFWLVNTAVSRAYDERQQISEVSEIYAIDSFISLSELITGEIQQPRCDAMARQIKSSLDSVVKNVSIELLDEAQKTDAVDKRGSKNFNVTEYYCVMKIDCAIELGNNFYLITVESDFTDILLYEKEIWNAYRIAVLLISGISGALLFLFSKRFTKPLSNLTVATEAIANGDYGKTVECNSETDEIVTLSNSFNSMSLAIKQAIDDVKLEVEKRETFIADFSHEMKTPLTAIIGYADMLRSYELDEEEQRASANAVFKEGKRLESLSMQMLDLMVLKREKCQLCFVNLGEVSATLKETLKFHCNKYGVTLSVKLQEVMVKANKALLLSLLYNLADKAFKASSKGKSVVIESRTIKDGVLISVSDHGKGIPEDKLSFITEPFWREDKARSRKEGSVGLGLSICKEIALQHSTTLEVSSTPNVGTTFSFTLKQGGDANENR